MPKNCSDLSQAIIMVGGVEIKGFFVEDFDVDLSGGLRLELTDEDWRIIGEATAPPGMRYVGRGNA